MSGSSVQNFEFSDYYKKFSYINPLHTYNSFSSTSKLKKKKKKNRVKVNPLSVNPTKWSNTLKQFVGNLPTNCLSVFDHFVRLAFKGLKVKKVRDILY